MCIYQLKIDSTDEGEVILWFSNQADAEAAVEEHDSFGGCAETWSFKYEMHDAQRQWWQMSQHAWDWRQCVRFWHHKARVRAGMSGPSKVYLNHER